MFCGSDKFVQGAQAPNGVLLEIETDCFAVVFAFLAKADDFFFRK
jgi:hypothetical protein